MDPSFTIFNSSSSDDELDIVLAFSVEEERLRDERGSTSRLGSVQRRRFIQRDFMDEYLRIAENTATQCLQYFVKSVISIYSDKYLRSPNNNDISRLLEVNARRGFPGMVGSIDYMLWKLKNCPRAWADMFSGHIHEPTIILEAVASYDLWIWQAFFGLSGSHNDFNMLEHSSLFIELVGGRAPPVNYLINGNDYTMGYYIPDGIYPSQSTFVKTIHAQQGNKRKHFAKTQESARKDVERAFGVL
ncbi:uncharacterized protein LOC133871570 [Alnus glutinosa]|uniref:uncharacterized protein LOC133871570 n=1 Tax=Alnus glutinosa TaxID=3517 RepID=UPI002D7924AE|nr:uncharacterized protein LOC133871570 [Alnus glutinosa]